MLFSSFDRVVAQLEHLLTFGKFFTIFSFLFGLSFAIQMRNADAEGRGILGPVHLAPAGAGAHRSGAQRVLHRRYPDHLRVPGTAADPVPQAEDPHAGHHRAGAGLQHPGPVAEHRAGQLRTPTPEQAGGQRRRCRRSSCKSRSGCTRSSNRARWRSWCPSISPAACSARSPSWSSRGRLWITFGLFLLGWSPAGWRFSGTQRPIAGSSAGCCGRPRRWRW